jgi:glycosyltransferase involved in cell wall biosynthesis
MIIGGPTMIKVSFVHDWLTGMRGGEKVLEVLCRRFPEAPLWTLIHNPGSVSSTITSRPIHTSWLQYLPFAAKYYRHYLPLFPLFAETNRAKGADVIVSTSHAVAKSMVKRKRGGRPFHICYIHTPMRYVWDMFDEYFGPDRVGRFASRFFFYPIARLLQLYDCSTLDRVDLFVANSTYVAERVRKFYNREAVVLPPPVDTQKFFKAVREPEGWYLVVSAMVPYKRVDQAIRACAAMRRPLKVVGKGPELERLTRLATDLNASVDFIGFASDQQLTDYYRRARALLFPGIEDFGIVPVEAIACGCPVIALAEGGVLDSMTKQTAVFYNSGSVEGLQEAMLRFESQESTFEEFALRSHAAKFSEAHFLCRFEEILKSVSLQTGRSFPAQDSAASVMVA